MNEINSAVYSKLNSATALTSMLAGTTAIYHMQAPDNATLPYVVFSHAAGGADSMTPKERENVLEFVRAYSDTSAAHAGSINTKIRDTLHKKSITVSGYANFWLQKEIHFENIDNLPTGNKVWMQGDYYRIRLEKE